MIIVVFGIAIITIVIMIVIIIMIINRIIATIVTGVIVVVVIIISTRFLQGHIDTGMPCFVRHLLQHTVVVFAAASVFYHAGRTVCCTVSFFVLRYRPYCMMYCMLCYMLQCGRRRVLRASVHTGPRQHARVIDDRCATPQTRH